MSGPPELPTDLRPENLTPDDRGQSEADYQAATGVSAWGYVFFAGLVVLLAGVAWRVVEEAVNPIVQGWLFVGLVLTLAPIFWHIVDVYHAVRSRRGLASAFVILTIVLGFVSLGTISYINVEIVKRRGWVYDTTSDKRFTLDEATVKLLEELEGTIYATYLEQAPRDIELRIQAEEQLQTFASASSNVRVKVLDSFHDKAETQAYLREAGVTKTSSGETDDVIVLSYAAPGREPEPGKHKELRIDRFEWLKRSTLGEDKWRGERLIADAMMELVYRRYRVYSTGGHGERELTEDMRSLRSALSSQNVEVVEKGIDLRATGEVPEDCDVLLILDPQVPFGPDENDAVRRYLRLGKTLLISVDARQGRRQLGLEPLLDEFGLYPKLNYVVVAPIQIGVAGGQALFEPHTTIHVQAHHYGDHPAVAALRSRAGFGTMFDYSSFVDVEEQPTAGLDVQALVLAPTEPGFTPHAALLEEGRRDVRAPIEGKDRLGGRLALAAAAEKEMPSGPMEEALTARIVYLADTDVMSDRVASQVPSNTDLVLGMIQWGMKREGLVAVSERTLETEVRQMTAKDRRMRSMWPLSVALLSLIAGGMVWWTRRR